MITRLILLLFIPLTWAGTYMVTFPNSLIPGVELDVRVHVIQASGDVNVVANLQHAVNDSRISSVNTVVTKGLPSTLKLQVPEGLQPSKYKISLSGTGGAVFSNVSEIRYEPNNLFMFIQTDKTRYSGGQEVKYRTLLFHPNMLGYKGRVLVTIYDGKNNKIEVSDYSTTQDGVISGRLVLNREPVFGKWRIEVKTTLRTVSKSFEVNDYVVPKFSVTFLLPENIKSTSTSFEISVKARFTFNADVFGKCTIQIYNKPTTTQYVEYSKTIVGEVNFTIPMADINNKLSSYEERIVRALVTDNATALTMVAETKLEFTSDKNGYQEPTPSHVTIQRIDHRDTFIPGLTYHTPIFVGRDKTPLGVTGVIRIKSTVTIAEEKDCMLNNPPYKWLDKSVTAMNEFTISFDESGYASLNVPIRPHTDKLELELTYDTANIREFYTLYAVSSKQDTFIATSIDKVHGQVGEKVTIVTESTAYLSGIASYEIYSKGILIKTVTTQMFNSKHSSMILELTPDMVPQAYVVVTHVTNTGQLLTDYVSLKIDGSPCKNKVSVQYNTTSLIPGGGLEMVVTADPNSTIYILVEDARNRLIGTENDIFLEEISEEVLKASHDVIDNLQSRGFGVRRKRYNLKNTKRKMIKNDKRKLNLLKNRRSERDQRSLARMVSGNEPYIESGVVIMSDISFAGRQDRTDLLMFNYVLPKECIQLTTTTRFTYPPGMFPTWVPGMVPTPAAGVTYAPDKIPTPAPGSTYAPGMFPTWVPGMVNTPAPGVTLPTTTLPPGIPVKDILRTRFPETWMWEEHSTGFNGRLTLIQTVPDSITSWISSIFATNSISGFGITETKDEITVKKNFFLSMDLPSTVILGEEVLVQITVFSYLSTLQQVFLQVTRSDDPNTPIPAATMVKPNEGHSTYVKVTPTQLGELKINVQARAGFSFTASATDSLEKSLIVRPRGVHKTTNHQRLVSVNPAGLPFTETIMFTDPPNIVPGTKHIHMRITGNFMIPSIKGLQNLINKPDGCGEQTMANLAPDVFVAKYLNLTGQLTSEVEINAKSYIISGYQHELSYRRNDGSFSIWGQRDTYGSTWLTAYVVKSFHQAREIVSIEDSILSRAVEWLLNKQNSDGSFVENLPVYYVDHRRTETDIKLSAFTLVALLEIEGSPYISTNKVQVVINRGKQYLESGLSTISDAYTLSIVCYALAKSKSNFGQSCFTKLEACKHTDGEMIYWTESARVTRRTNEFKRQVWSLPARDIETTAYALLTYMALGHHAYAFPIVRWLVSQRNPYGGFQSTHDTVMAIQALTEYSSAHSQLTTNYGLQFNAFGLGFMHSYSASQQNYDSIHEVEIPANLSNVIIQAMGKGVAVVDIVQSYYVSSVTSGNHISVTATIVKESLNSLTVHSTVSWTGTSASHMIMVEVEMPTGFVPDNDFFRDQQLIRRHETNGRMIALYLDGINPYGQVTVRVKMDRADPVVKNKACHISVYDYYEPTEQAITIYESGLLKSANICDVCPLCNFCTGTSGFSQIGIGK